MALEKREKLEKKIPTINKSKTNLDKENNKDQINFINEINSSWIDNLMYEFSNQKMQRKTSKSKEKIKFKENGEGNCNVPKIGN